MMKSRSRSPPRCLAAVAPTWEPALALPPGRIAVGGARKRGTPCSSSGGSRATQEYLASVTLDQLRAIGGQEVDEYGKVCRRCLCAANITTAVAALTLRRRRCRTCIYRMEMPHESHPHAHRSGPRRARGGGRDVLLLVSHSPIGTERVPRPARFARRPQGVPRHREAEHRPRRRP